MCMEDIRLMRKTVVNDGTLLPSDTNIVTIQQNDNRTFLLVQNVGTNPITLTLGPKPTFGFGLSLGVGSSPVLFDLQKVGILPGRGFSAICGTGLSSVLYFQESILEQQ